MTKHEQRQLLIRNAGIWVAATLLSVVLPMISDSLTEGRGTFLRLMLHVGPLLAAMQVANTVTSKALGPPSDA